MNVEAFNDTILPVKDKLYRFALSVVKSSSDAEDIVQEAFIKIWNKRQDWSKVQNMEAFMMRITKNLALDKVRSASNKLNVPLEDRSHQFINVAPGPDAHSEMNDMMKNIHQAMDELPEKQRMIIHLRDIEGCSYKEICDQLELDMNQVKVNLFRARKTIKEIITKLNSYGFRQDQATS